MMLKAKAKLEGRDNSFNAAIDCGTRKIIDFTSLNIETIVKSG
jgi:hypothetical protein